MRTLGDPLSPWERRDPIIRRLRQPHRHYRRHGNHRHPRVPHSACDTKWDQSSTAHLFPCWQDRGTTLSRRCRKASLRRRQPHQHDTDHHSTHKQHYVDNNTGRPDANGAPAAPRRPTPASTASAPATTTTRGILNWWITKPREPFWTALRHTYWQMPERNTRSFFSPSRSQWRS